MSFEDIEANLKAMSKLLSAQISSSDDKELIDPVLNYFNRVMESNEFKAHVASPMTKHAQLIKIMSSYLSEKFHPSQVIPVERYMETFITSKLSTLFQIDEEEMDVHITASEDEAELFALRSAMHRAYPSLAQVGASSCRRPPVFYFSQGSHLAHSSSTRSVLAWNLMLPVRCFEFVEATTRPPPALPPPALPPPAPPPPAAAMTTEIRKRLIH
eukprot:jgi/Bigna1/83249/fgenesh1_pg.104_\